METISPGELRLLVQVQELKDRLAELAHENAELRVERDIARAQVQSLLPAATPEEEAEFQRQLEAGEFIHGPEAIERIIGELER